MNFFHHLQVHIYFKVLYFHFMNHILRYKKYEFIFNFHMSYKKYEFIFNFHNVVTSLRYGLVVRIPGSHPGGPGSIPGIGILFVHVM
jgi:hypothetical protein